MLEVLFFVVFDLFGEVVVQNGFVMLSSGSLEKENVFEFGRSGYRCIDPLTIYEENLQPKIVISPSMEEPWKE